MLLVTGWYFANFDSFIDEWTKIYLKYVVYWICVCTVVGLTPINLILFRMFVSMVIHTSCILTSHSSQSKQSITNVLLDRIIYLTYSKNLYSYCSRASYFFPFNLKISMIKINNVLRFSSIWYKLSIDLTDILNKIQLFLSCMYLAFSSNGNTY